MLYFPIPQTYFLDKLVVELWMYCHIVNFEFTGLLKYKIIRTFIISRLAFPMVIPQDIA